MALLQKILHDPFISVDGRWISPDISGEQRRDLRSGGYYEFNGTDNSVEYSDSVGTTGKATYLVKCRVDGTRVFGGGWGSYRASMIIGPSSLQCVKDAAVTQNNTFSGLTLDDDYHRLAIRIDFSGSNESVELWVDGVAKTATSLATGTVTMTARTLGSKNGADSFFDGPISEFAAYEDLLSDAEIEAWSAGGDPPAAKTANDVICHCDEGSGTTAYDVSGNGNHGTIGGSLTSFHQTDIELRSWHNEVGYNLSGSTYIPRLETAANQALAPASQTDVLGNTLTYYGRAKYDGLLKSNCVTTNGTDNEGNSASAVSVGSGDFYYKIIFDAPAQDGDQKRIMASGHVGVSGSVSVYKNLTTQNILLVLTDRTGSVLSNSPVFFEETEYSEGDLLEVEFSRSGSTLSYSSINHTTGFTDSGTKTTSDDFSPTKALELAPYTAVAVTYHFFEIGSTASNLLHQYVFGEGDGDTTYDRVGTNHGTLRGSLTGIWTTSEYQEPHNNKVGFDRWKNDATGADLFVPLQTNGTSIRTSGDTLSGYTWQTKVSTGSDKHHNGSDTEIHQPEDCPQLYDVDQNEFATSIWYDAAGVPQAVAGRMLVENYLSADAWLNRLDSLEIQEDNIAALDQWNLSGVTDGNSDRGQLYGVYLHDSDSDYDTSIWLFDDPSGLPGSTPPFNSHLVAYFKTGVNNYTGTATLSEYNDSGISGAVEILTNGGTWAPDEEFTYQMRLETWADWQVGEEEIPTGGVFYGGLSLSLSLGA